MHATRKVFDISPPQPGGESLEESKQNIARLKNPRILFLWVVIILGGLGATGVILHVFFSRAKVFITLETQELTIQKQIVGFLKTETGDRGKWVIPLTMLTQEEEAIRLFPSSGKKVKEQKAEGIIRVFNLHFSLVKLVVNTRFISEGGKLFQSRNSIAIPPARKEGAKTIAGFVDAEVEAAESGETYNIESSNFSLPGLVGSPLYTSVYGKSFQSMKGGSKTEIAIATESDIAQARNEFVESLEKKAQEILKKKVSLRTEMLQETFLTQVLQVSPLVKAGAEIPQFHLQAKVRVTVFSFQKKDLEDLARESLENSLEEKEKLDENNVDTSYEVGNANRKEGTVMLNVRFLGKKYIQAQEKELTEDLKGVSIQDANRILARHPGVQKAEILVWPFWILRIPQDTERIQTQFSID